MWGCMVLWLAALFVACCRAQECATSCELGLQTCSIIDYPIFYHNTSEVNSAESVATQIIAFTQIAGLSTACANTLAPFICNQYHPSCETNISSTGTPVPILSCIEMCNNLNAVCGEYKTNTLASIARYFNCSDESIYTPEGSTNCSYINSNVPTCSNDTSPISGYTGSCQKFDPQIAPTSYETCAPFTTEYVWVSQNSPFIVALLDQNLNQSIYNMKVSFPIVPIDCYENVLGVICALFFPPCQIEAVPEYNTSVAVPNQACFSICETAFDVCEDFFIQANLNFSLSICAALPTTTPYQYPLIGTDVNVTTTCHTTLIPDGAIAPFTLPVVEQCPMETGKKTHVTDSDAVCGLKCPDSSYTDNEWHDLVILTQVGSSLSLVCMAFLITSYMLTYERRKFPSALHFWEFVATSGFAISFLIGGTDPAKNVWCYDEGTYATQANNAACGTQGFFFIFFGLALAAWCCIIAFIMFYGIVLGRKVVNLEEYSAFFHLFGWGVPLVFGIAALGSGSIGYGPPLAWCFIQFKGFGMGTGNGISMDYPLFYIPVGVLFLAILVMFWATVAKIIYVRKLKVDDKSVGKAGSRTFKAQVRVLIFIFVVFAICFTLFEWRFQVEATNRKNNLGFIGLQWTYCKVKQQLNSTDAGYCPGDHNPARVDYGHTAFESFLLSGVGLLIFIGFGADLGIYRHWRKILRLVSSREWGVLRDLVVFGKDPFASSSETGRSKSHSKSASKNSAGSKNSKNSNSGVSKADQTSASMEETERRSRFIREESVGDVDLSQLSETPPPPKKEIEVFII